MNPDFNFTDERPRRRPMLTLDRPETVTLTVSPPAWAADFPVREFQVCGHGSYPAARDCPTLAAAVAAWLAMGTESRLLAFQSKAWPDGTETQKSEYDADAKAWSQWEAA
jgi:hypothetical protein